MGREVLLVNPNRIRPPIAPLAIEYLSHSLDKSHFPCRVADLCLAEDPAGLLRDALKDSEPLLVGVSFRNTDDCYCATQHSFIPELRTLVSTMRSMTQAPIVLGGSGFSIAPEGILSRTGADMGIVGDGENALVLLAKALECKHGVENVPGLVWAQENSFRMNPLTWDLPIQQPLPRASIDNERYFREGGQLGIETKRGCPMACTYCADRLGKGARVRPRPAGAVAEEMLQLAKRGMDVFHTCDSEFNNDLGHALEVCRALEARRAASKLRWYAYCAPIPFPPELARLMGRAGCVGINFGVDSGDAEMLRRLGRSHTAQDVVEAVRLCRENGVATMLDFLLGAPGETPASVARSIRLVREAEADCAGLALGVRLYPGTPLSDSLKGTLRNRETAGFHGLTDDNDDLAMPLFYLDPALGEDPAALVRELVGGDERFFFSWPDETRPDYNYDGHCGLIAAIAEGHRGAYWDLLRKRQGEL